MLSKADTDIKAVIGLFTSRGIASAFLVPTVTGLDKSIMDATHPLREFLKQSGLHDYDKQGQGPDHKVKLQAQFVLPDRLEATTVSLYRPETKSGDPRIWFSGLGAYAKPGNLLAVIVFDKKLYVANASRPDILAAIDDPSSAFGSIILAASAVMSDAASELLGKMRDIAKQDFIPTMREGDTGIGMTLETLLGIRANSKRTPDYRGIEIKASRRPPSGVKDKNRVTLFSQVPNWKASPISKARTLLDEYGYVEDGRLQLFCTLSALKPNSQRLMLETDMDADLLRALDRQSTQDRNLLQWELSKLKARLGEKHPESFWVKAESKEIGGKEHFRYHTVVHTVKPIVTNLDYLLEDGTVTMDLTMSAKQKGVRDHGYLFKMWASDFDRLFPAARSYNL